MRLSAALPLLLLVGCAAPEVSYYQDIKPILDGRCVSCHQEGQVAPFALDNAQDAADYADLIVQSVEQGLMPPFGADSAVAEYLFDPSLSDAQLGLLRDWAADGAPSGRPADEGQPIEPVGAVLSRVDRELWPDQSYTPAPAAGETDDYRCFVIDWGDEDGWVTGFNAVPGNDAVVHHVAAFLMTPDTILGDAIFDQIAGWDEDHEGPGYRCFGGPSGGDGASIPAQQLGQWVPGQQGMDFPEGTGIFVPGGSQIVLQLHYFVEEPAPEPDRTGIQLRLGEAAEIERPAAFGPVLDSNWVLGGMPIPAGERGVTHSWEGNPRSMWDFTLGDIDVEEGFVIHGVLMHLHRRGASTEAWVARADGTREPIISIPRWDFDWQLNYSLAQPITVGADDRIGVSCTWNNGPGDQPTPGQEPVDVDWGEGSDDEMCVANLYISEL